MAIPEDDLIEVYAFSTPNSVRVPVALEEMGLEYRLNGVNLRKGEQKQPEFLARNANGKVPVLVDPHGPGGAPLTLSESGAILVYLAEKTGKLLPREGAMRARVFEQIFFHVSGIGPAFGQLGFFKRQASERIPLAIDRFQAEAERTLSVLDGVLAQREYAAGEAFTIADVAHFGWIWRHDFVGLDLAGAPHVARWFAAVSARPGVARAVERVMALAPA